MKTCLQLYHHSWFPALAPDEKDKEKEDGEGEVKENKKTAKKKKKGKKGDGELEPRKINVELTYVALIFILSPVAYKSGEMARGGLRRYELVC